MQPTTCHLTAAEEKLPDECPFENMASRASTSLASTPDPEIDNNLEESFSAECTSDSTEGSTDEAESTDASNEDSNEDPNEDSNEESSEDSDVEPPAIVPVHCIDILIQPELEFYYKEDKTTNFIRQAWMLRRSGLAERFSVNELRELSSTMEFVLVFAHGEKNPVELNRVPLTVAECDTLNSSNNEKETLEEAGMVVRTFVIHIGCTSKTFWKTHPGKGGQESKEPPTKFMIRASMPNCEPAYSSAFSVKSTRKKEVLGRLGEGEYNDRNKYYSEVRALVVNSAPEIEETWEDFLKRDKKTWEDFKERKAKETECKAKETE